MHSFALGAGIACLLVWTYLLTAHAGFWQVGRLRARKPSLAMNVRIAAVIPARDEAGVIARSVQSLLRQTGISPLNIFVVDDNSSDGTAEIARSVAPDDDRLTVITGKPLPPGWSGKVWAMQQGVERALSLEPDFLLLTDADIEHEPDGIARLANLADQGDYDIASFMVSLHCETLAEKLLVPSFVFYFLLLYPPLWIRNPRRKIAGAAGGCLLIRPEALQRAGGLEAIRHEIIDDCSLARVVKQSGGKVWLGVTQDTISIRPHHSFAEIEHMVTRTAFNQLRHSAVLLLLAIAGLVLTYIVPLALLFSGSRALTLLGAAAYAMMFVTYLPTVRLYRVNWIWALTLPLSAMFFMAASIHSAVKYWSGRGGEWKGRAQDNV